MNPRSSFVLFAFAAMSLPSLAFAALGGDVASVQVDQQNMKATHRVARSESQYTVHELQMPSGTVVREFVAANGAVFGVAWKGPTVPDLQQVLGQYFDKFVAAPRSKQAGHHHLQIRQADFVVRASGHMRAFSGSAYLPGMLPQGVAADAIF